MTVPEFYGRHVALYDRLATAPGVARWRRAAANSLSLSPGDTVVEMGCGTGANLTYLRECVGSRGTVIGIDLTRPLLERTRVDGRGNAKLMEADATCPPLRCDTVDAVVASFVLGMFQDPAAAVTDWCTLVGEGGRIALLDAAPSAHPVGRALNPAFRAFTRGTAPSDSTLSALQSAVAVGTNDTLEPRVHAGRKVVVEQCDDRLFREFALGFVGLLAGTVK